MAYWGSFAEGLAGTLGPALENIGRYQLNRSLSDRERDQRKQEREEEEMRRRRELEDQRRYQENMERMQQQQQAELYKAGLEPEEFTQYLQETQLQPGTQGPVYTPDYPSMSLEQSMMETGRLGGYAIRKGKERGREEKQREKQFEDTLERLREEGKEKRLFAHQKEIAGMGITGDKYSKAPSPFYYGLLTPEEKTRVDSIAQNEEDKRYAAEAIYKQKAKEEFAQGRAKERTELQTQRETAGRKRDAMRTAQAALEAWNQGKIMPEQKDMTMDMINEAARIAGMQDIVTKSPKEYWGLSGGEYSVNQGYAAQFLNKEPEDLYPGVSNMGGGDDTIYQWMEMMRF